MYKAIEPATAHDLIQEGAVTVVDIRDPDSF
jgi:rhodanese-related sulfurtransferase